MDEELVPVLVAELRQREAHQVEDVVQEVVDGQRAHQRVKVAHHLKKKRVSNRGLFRLGWVLLPLRRSC